MENTFMEQLKKFSTMKQTENGAVAYSSTNNKLYDLFSLGGAYRERSSADKVKLFSESFKEVPEDSLKCLFYLRDVRGGQGERQFFRDCFEYVLKNEYLLNNTIIHLLKQIPNYGRWDDVLYFYNRINKYIDEDIINIVHTQLSADMISEYPSLLAKWMPSENASNKETMRKAKKLASALRLSPKEYRKILSHLRERIKVLERLMSENRWDEIEFDKIPSKAGHLYRNTFLNREETKERYTSFIESPKTKVNSSVLYPYEIISPLFNFYGGIRYDISNSEMLVAQKYWENLPNYFTGKYSSAMCVVDVSGSMYGTPIKVALSLGLYCAERMSAPFKNTFITFSSNPEVVNIKGGNIVSKLTNMSNANWGSNTDLPKVFNLLLNIALSSEVKYEDIPSCLIIISDMEIDGATCTSNYGVNSTMENIRKDWERHGLKMPHLVYWNVNARNDTLLDLGENVTCVSGLSPVTFEMILSGKTGTEVMYDKLYSERYKDIKIL